MNKSKLIIVRHGQSEWNKQDKFTGWVDVPLSVEGKEEAKAAGEKIKKLDFNFDYSFIAETVPRKRVGSPEDIAGLCIYFCSRAGSYTVGETVTCDGGLVKTL